MAALSMCPLPVRLVIYLDVETAISSVTDLDAVPILGLGYWGRKRDEGRRWRGPYPSQDMAGFVSLPL